MSEHEEKEIPLDNEPVTQLTHREISVILSEYPDLVADALEKYRKVQAEAKRVFSSKYLILKSQTASEEGITETFLKHSIEADIEYYKAKLNEIIAEAEHQRLYETLMCAKKLASLRAAY